MLSPEARGRSQLLVTFRIIFLILKGLFQGGMLIVCNLEFRVLAEIVRGKVKTFERIGPHKDVV